MNFELLLLLSAPQVQSHQSPCADEAATQCAHLINRTCDCTRAHFRDNVPSPLIPINPSVRYQPGQDNPPGPVELRAQSWYTLCRCVFYRLSSGHEHWACLRWLESRFFGLADYRGLCLSSSVCGRDLQEAERHWSNRPRWAMNRTPSLHALVTPVCMQVVQTEGETKLLWF